MQLRVKVMIMFLLVSLVPLIVLSVIFMTTYEQNVINQVGSHLETVASVQQNRVSELVGDDQERLLFLTKTTDLPYHFGSYLQNQTDNSPLIEMSNIIEIAQESSTVIQEISILNLEGIVIASTVFARLNTNHSLSEYFIKGRNKLITFIMSLDENHLPIAYNTVPIANQTSTLGVLLMITSMEEILNVVKDYSGLGNSGETVLAERTLTGDALFLTSLRFDEGAALNRSISLENIEVPMIQALQQNEGFHTEAEDYRGKKVLASTRYINATDWGLVVKIDQVEAYSPITEMRNVVIVSVFLVSIIATILSLFFTRTLTTPILSLTGVTQKIIDGDLTQRADIVRTDEIGTLANSFNEMTENLLKINLELDQKVKDRTIDLERINEELRQFAHVASHDLQEPLRMVTSFLQLLSNRYSGKLDAEATEFINYAVDGAKRMHALINDLLVYSRIGSQGLPFDEVDIGEIIAQVIDDLRIVIQETNAKITYDRHFPQILADSSQFNQLFQNLIINAIRFHSEETPHINISATRLEKSVQISVSDNGIGIKPEFHERIFVIFQRLHTREEFPGTGIGLAICKAIVERHRGKIWVESEGIPGKGSTFIFAIPYKKKGSDS